VSRSLAGRTILVTRPRDDEARSLADRLRERGAAVIEAPTIEIVPLDDSSELDEAVRELAAGGFSWVSFSSPRAVDTVLDRLHSFGLPPRLPAKIAAVGPATAERLRSAGIETDFLADPHTTSALADAFPTGHGRVLLPRADLASEDLEDACRAKGWTPVRVTAYRTRFPEQLTTEAREALEGGGVDAIVFTSASTVRGFVQTAGVPNGPRVVCIGPVTTEAAERAGFTVDAVAEPHTVDGIVRAVENLWT
jgi:uroporphyrinogen III methyltransferase / synthase